VKFRVVSAFALLSLLAAGCGSASSESNNETTAVSVSGSTTTSSTLPDPREPIRQQAASFIDGYLNNMIAQMPEVTSKVTAEELIKCVRDRVNQVVDGSQQAEGQPTGDFISGTLTQIQSGMFSLVGSCSQVVG
jgi:ABC-type Fe3+-citrate transport system substrate-binding protein